MKNNYQDHGLIAKEMEIIKRTCKVIAAQRETTIQKERSN